MPTVSKEVRVVNSRGFHARPAMQFADVANQFKSEVKVFKGGEEPGEADGEDAETAVSKLAELFDTGFGEED